MKKLLIILSICLFITGAKNVVAATPSPELQKKTVVNFAKDPAIKKITAYLNGLSTIKSDFLQISTNGNTVKGTFYLARPDSKNKNGRFRFEYASAPILLITQDDNLIYFDKELNQVTRIDIDDTPLKFLLEKTVKIDPENILDIKKEGGTTKVKLKEKGKPEELTLVFKNSPFSLKEWIVKDVQRIETTVTLMRPKYGAKIDDKLFEFKRPKKKRRR